ncbi:MAG: hypothetical protein M1813_002194 [Trichoglossum hirsutum]|nr:MAG: hypothetical protein M1813_002194 [Trichoglossum hirsutum]
MDLKGGSQPLSSLDVLWNNYKRSSSRSTRGVVGTDDAAGSGNRRSTQTALAPTFKPSFPFDACDNGDRKSSRLQRATSTGAIPTVPRALQPREISDIEKLSLGQEQDSMMLRSPDRDRGLPRVGLAGDAPSQGNPARSRSWRKQLDPEFTRTVPGEGDGELARPSSGTKRLFDPTTDNPNLRSDVVRALDPANLAPAAAMAPRVYDKQAHVFRSKKEPQRRKDIWPRDVCSPVPQKQAVQPHGEQVFAEKNLGLVLQPETRPISQEQLVAEVKGIYAGLVMVEAKCVDVDNKQARDAQEAEPGKQPKLNNEQWQALIALHRTLLHEHHDFFLASQHPSASPALRRLASKYAMPARMWRHGIHSFLELLRHRLPDSPEHMLAFIYLAYSMMALL